MHTWTIKSSSAKIYLYEAPSDRLRSFCIFFFLFWFTYTNVSVQESSRAATLPTIVVTLWKRSYIELHQIVKFVNTICKTVGWSLLNARWLLLGWRTWNFLKVLSVKDVLMFRAGSLEVYGKQTLAHNSTNYWPYPNVRVIQRSTALIWW